MRPGIIRHMQISWDVARIAGIWHRINYFDNKSKPGLFGTCNNKAIGLLWPQDDAALRDTIRHEAFHLSVFALPSEKWPDIDALSNEARSVVMLVPAFANALHDYEERGLPVTDEPLVVLSEITSDGGDISDLGASPRLIALIREIVRPKPFKPALRAAVHVLAALALVATVIMAV